MKKLSTSVFTFCFLLFTFNFCHSQKYWIGGTGNWSDVNHWSLTSGGLTCSCTPTATDDVFFDGNSFSTNAQTVNIDVTASCNNMDWSALTKSSIQMSGGQDLHVYGSLTMKSTMVINWTGALWFESTTTANAITSAGKSFSSEAYFNGNGGDWTLQDAFSTTGNIHIIYGTFLSNNKNITANGFESGYSNIRGLTLGSSIVTLNGGWPYYGWSSGGSNFAFDAGTSTIKIIGSGTNVVGGSNDGFYDVLFQNGTNASTVQGGLAFHNVTFSGSGTATTQPGSGTSYHTVSFSSDGTLNNNGIFDSLIFAAGHTYIFQNAVTQTINNGFVCNGTCNSPIILHSNSVGSQATISAATGTVTVSYVQMQDINATGGASFNANNSTDILNNTGWNFVGAPADLYWIGGTGNWNSPTHWSTTTGGASACVIPGPSTNVHFDANSFSANAQIVTLNVPAYCNSMDWSAITKTSIQMSGANDAHIFGSLTLKSTLVLTNYTAGLWFESINAGNTITSAGKTFPNASNQIYFNGNGGDWTLQDNFTTVGDIWLTYGTFYTNNKNLTSNSFTSANNNVRGFTLGTSTVTITGNYNGWYSWSTSGTNFNFDAGTSLIRLTQSAANLNFSAGVNDVFYDVTFTSTTGAGAINGGQAYHNVTLSGTTGVFNQITAANTGTSFHIVNISGDANLTGNSTYDSLLFSAGHQYILYNTFTQTINNYFKAVGTCNSPIFIHSNNWGLPGTISQATGTVTITNAQLQDINATGGATFTANTTTDLGGNTGWTFTSTPTDLYWIGGTGNWNSTAHWSLTSGGVSACMIPGTNINAHFDANSFSSNAQTVTMNVDAFCKSMDWSAITKTSIQWSGNVNIYIYGSLTMKNSMVITNLNSPLYFESTSTGNTITSAGKIFSNGLNAVYFNGNGGEWTLQDAFTTSGDMWLNYGAFYTNNKNLTANSFNSANNNVREAHLGSSMITLTGNYNGWGNAWDNSGTNFALDAGTSLIRITQATNIALTTGPNEGFYDVLFQSGTLMGTVNGGLAFHNVTFDGTAGTIAANNGTSFHNVFFNGDGNLNNNAVFDSLTFSAGHTYTLENTKTQTIANAFIANGVCGNSIILQSNSAGTQAMISKASGNVTVNYVQFKDSKATGGAAFVANNSVNNGNNTGWQIVGATPVVAAYTNSQNGMTSTFTNNSTGATSYKWIFGDGTFSTLQNPVHTYNLGGNYNVCLVAFNSCGTSDTVCNNVNAGCYAPVANYTASVNGLKATFTNSSTNAATILWKFGDATTSSALNPVHTYFNSGTYTVCLTISNGCGIDSVCKTYTVTCAPPIAAYYYGVNGMAVNFANTSSNAATSSWNFGDTQTSTLNNPSHTYNAAGTYSVSLTVANGCGTDVITQTVNIICAAPAANFVTNPQGLAVDFVSTSTNATSVSWDFGDGSPTSILPTVNHTYSATGTYSVCLTAINGCGSNTFCMTVSVCASPTANFTSSSNILTATFNNTSTNGINWYWTFGDAYASNQMSPVHTYTASGTYSVCLNASNACGSNTKCSTVNIICTPFTGQTLCMVTVDSTSTHNLIVWEKPVTTSIDSFTIYREVASVFSPVATVPYSKLTVYTDTTPGVNPNTGSYKYEVSLMDTCGNVSALSGFHRTMLLQVSVALPPNSYNLSWNDYIGYTVTKYKIMRAINNGSYTAIDSTSFGTTAWTDANSYAATDTVAYQIEVKHPSGCTATIKNPSPLAINLNSSKSNVYKVTDSTATYVNDEDENSSIEIYPNPNAGQLNIQCSIFHLGEKYELRIYDLLGKKIYQSFITTNKSSVDLRGYSRGIYHLQIINGNNIVNKKIIVQ